MTHQTESKVAQEGADGLAAPARYWAIASLLFSTAAVVLDGSVASIALPTIARDLGIGNASSVLVVTIYQFILVISLIPMSALGDRFGYRHIYRLGLTIFLAGTLTCLWVSDIAMLLVLRVMQGVGAALVLSVSSALLRQTYPVRILGSGLAINSMTVSTFTALAPVAGGYILSWMHWNWVFALASPMAFIALCLSPALPPVIRRSDPFDWSSAARYVVVMALLFLALDAGMGLPVLGRGSCLLAAALIGRALLHRERGKLRPIIPVDLMARPLIALSALGALLSFTASMAILVLMPFRLGQMYGFTAAEIGVMISAWPLATLVVAPAVGFLSDRLPAWIVGATGLWFAVTALLLLLTLDVRPDPIDVQWRLAICGAGFACYTTSNMRLLLASSPQDRAAAVGGLISTVRLIGQSLGAMLGAIVLADGFVASPQGLLIPAGIALAASRLSLSRKAHFRQG